MMATSLSFDSGDPFKFNPTLYTGFNQTWYYTPKIPTSLSSPSPVIFTVAQKQESPFQERATFMCRLKSSSRSCFWICPEANEHFLSIPQFYWNSCQGFMSTPSETATKREKTKRHLHRLMWNSISSLAIRIRYDQELQRVEVKRGREKVKKTSNRRKKRLCTAGIRVCRSVP